MVVAASESAEHVRERQEKPQRRAYDDIHLEQSRSVEDLALLGGRMFRQGKCETGQQYCVDCGEGGEDEV